MRDQRGKEVAVKRIFLILSLVFTCVPPAFPQLTQLSCGQLVSAAVSKAGSFFDFSATKDDILTVRILVTAANQITKIEIRHKEDLSVRPVLITSAPYTYT